jgi:hypothetical protein
MSDCDHSFSDKEIMKRLLAGGFAYVTEKIFYLNKKRKHCNLQAARERLFQDTHAISLQKGSNYTAMFDHV